MTANLIDLVSGDIEPSRIAAITAFLDERSESVHKSLVLQVPLLIGALSGRAQARAHGRRAIWQLHSDLTSASVDLPSIEALALTFAERRVAPILRMGRHAGLSLIGPRYQALAPALVDIVDVQGSSARLLVDLAVTLTLGSFKRMAIDRLYDDPYQLADLLAAQYIPVATRIDPRLTLSLGYASVAAWLSSIGADGVTCHPMASPAQYRSGSVRR